MTAETTPRTLVGTWRLVSFHLKTLDGQLTHPYGPDAVRYYIFSESGYVSVALMPAHRRKFAAGDVMGGSTEEKVAAAETFIGYSGKYEIKETNSWCARTSVFSPTGWALTKYVFVSLKVAS